MELKCMVCGKELTGSQRKYCSTICKNKSPKTKELTRLYRQKPEVKEKIKKQQREYNQRPEVKKRLKKQRKEYNQRPEVKERVRKRLQRPEVKEQIKIREQVKNLKKKLRKNKIHYFYDNKCARCGFDKVLDIHHINENGKEDRFFKKDMKEYIVLCPNCHTLVSRGYLTKQDILPYQKK